MTAKQPSTRHGGNLQHKLVVLLALIVLTLPPALAQGGQQKPLGHLPQAPTTDEGQVDQILREHKVSLELQCVPLGQAVENLKEAYPAFTIDWDHVALEEAGIRKDRPMTHSFANISLKSALKILLKDAQLTWVIRDGGIVITTAPVRGRTRYVTYAVTDLVMPVEGRVSPLCALDNCDGGGADKVELPGDSTPPMQQSPQHLRELLIRLIKEKIDPESWVDVDSKCTIEFSPWSPILIVCQTQDVHEQITDLLEALRGMSGLQVALEGPRLPYCGNRWSQNAGRRPGRARCEDAEPSCSGDRAGHRP